MASLIRVSGYIDVLGSGMGLWEMVGERAIELAEEEGVELELMRERVEELVGGEGDELKLMEGVGIGLAVACLVAFSSQTKLTGRSEGEVSELASMDPPN